MYSNIEHTQLIELQLNRLKKATVKLVAAQNQYIQERKPALITSFDIHYSEFENEYAGLAKLLLNEPKFFDQLSVIEHEVELLRQTLKRFEQLQIKLGYEANKGVYGLFRHNVHQLQNYVQQADLSDLKIKVLLGVTKFHVGMSTPFLRR